MGNYSTAYALALLPEPDLTVSQWADEHRILDQASSSEAGRWRTSRTPYLREIMDSLSASDPTDVVVFQKGRTDRSKSEAGINFVLVCDKSRTGTQCFMYCQPSTLLKRVSQNRD